MSGQTVLFERQETLKLAQGTTDGKLQGAVQGYWEALKETAGIVKEGAHTLYAAAKGDEAAWQAIEKGAGAAADYLKEPSNWPYLLGAMTPEQREQLALAYESGNGSEIGRLMAQQVANMPIGGGPMGSIKKIDDVVEAAGKGNATIVVDSKGNALVGDWSPTKTLTSPENATAHWTKHASEFPQFSNVGQYVAGVQNFVTNPPAGTLIKSRPNGDTLFFDPATDTFAVRASSGVPRTMFKPDPLKHGYPTNLDYFNAQK
jgi:filamentous hemagglutinin